MPFEAYQGAYEELQHYVPRANTASISDIDGGESSGPNDEIGPKSTSSIKGEHLNLQTLPQGLHITTLTPAPF